MLELHTGEVIKKSGDLNKKGGHQYRGSSLKGEGVPKYTSIKYPLERTEVAEVHIN